ncbi:MAG: hypothetical protein GTN51_06455 [Armatimonadetes bacterium]|nr:hypothetical protein [Armatimonadota bacterium]
MARLFSKRYSDSLRDEKLKVSIPTPVRERLWMSLEEYSEFDCLKGEYTAITELTQRFEEELGSSALRAYPESEDGDPASGGLYDIFLKGYWAPHVFDAMELFHQGASDEDKPLFQERFNEIMERSKMSWQMSEGKISPVDSARRQGHTKEGI